MEPNPALVARLAAAVSAAAAERGASDAGATSGATQARSGTADPVVAEWSQVATSHAGRIYVDGEHFPLPEPASEAFRALREDMRSDTRGAWFSARLELGPGAPVFEANYTTRVYWNGPAMFAPPEAGGPIPTDEDWAAELRRHPRTPEFTPEWIRAEPEGSPEFTDLRAALENAGLPLGAARLPGETHVTFEGAVLVRELDSGVYSIDVFDYGQLHHIGTQPAARGAGMLAWNYLSSPLPDPVTISPRQLEERIGAAAAGYADLTARISAAGPGGVVTNLPPGAPFDRWGGIDGFYVFAWDTPLPQRSLPPTAVSEGAARVGFVANRPVPVQAELAPAWFDQPGGGVRLRTREPLRDLVRASALSVVRVV